MKNKKNEFAHPFPPSHPKGKKLYSQTQFQLLPRNRKGDIPTNILVLGIVLVCGIALISFFYSTVKMRDSFVGIGLVEQLNSQIEENSFYGRQVGTVAVSGDIGTAINYASENKIVNRKCNCGSNCNNYASWMADSSSKNGIPDSILLLSLMMQESDCNQNAFSGSSVGLMQINLIHCGKFGLPSNKDECKKQLLENPQMNIEIGAEILKESYNLYKSGKIFNGCSNRGITYTDWDAAIRGYNGWGCGKDSNGNPFTAQDNYVEEVNQRYNSLRKIGNYLEKDVTKGILWWAKETLSFSVEYKGKP
ncbi:Membrane-bound lytic murein transglycosylase C [uncultured archaeon]|nr:Membrane-bound lytic murein transglycosylase C [uncultured archaeon]